MGDFLERRQKDEPITEVSYGAWQQRRGAFHFIDTFWTALFLKMLKSLSVLCMCTYMHIICAVM